VIKTHAGEKKIANRACRAFCDIAAFAPGAEACAAAGAVPAILSVLKAHNDAFETTEWDIYTLCNYIGALCNISHVCSGAEACVAAGAVPSLVAALKSHPSVASVVAEACAALRNIAALPAGKAAILAADARPLIVSAFRGFAGGDARRFAIAALTNLGFNVGM
jgi:hypothetical protein